MAIETKVTLKSHFERGDQPTSAQFSNLIDSMIKLPVSGDTAKNGFIEVVNTAESTAHVPATLGRNWLLNVETTAQGRDLLAITSASALGGGTVGLGLLAAEVTASAVSQLGVIPIAQLASATDTSIGAIEIATTAEVSAREAGDRAITPAALNAHPMLPKVMINFNGSAQASARLSYGVSAVVKDGTGTYTMTYTTPFANSFGQIFAQSQQNTTSGVPTMEIDTHDVSGCTMTSWLGTGAAHQATDAHEITITVWGDQ
jgi:hypothetical protein